MSGTTFTRGENPLRAEKLNQALAERVMRAGDTMGGSLILYGPPTKANEATTKQYVDASIAAGAGGGQIVNQFNGRSGFVNLTTKDVTDAGGAPINAPVFTGDARAATPPPGDNDTSIATTAFVVTALGGSSAVAGVSTFNTRKGDVVLNTKDITDASGAPIASPSFTGTPLSITMSAATNNTTIATTAFVHSAIANDLPSTAVTSFNGRVGPVTLTSGDVTTALTFTPYSATNPSGYQTAAQVSASITAAAYTLPTASTSVLGGVKVDGSTVTISGGVISASAGGYTLPTASTTVLGGVKIDGTTVTISGGVLSASGSGVTTINFGTTGLTPASATNGAVTVAGTLVVSNGGTGATSLPSGAVLLGNGGGGIANAGTGTSGQVLTSNGASAPTFQTLTVPISSTNTPLMDSGIGGAGTGTKWSRDDHFHPTDTTRAPTASPTFTGTVTATAATMNVGAFTSTGITASPISGSTGSFTTLAASSTVSGTGFTNYMASPPAIGGTAANTGKFTNLTVTGTVTVPAASIPYSALPTEVQQLPIAFPFAGKPNGGALVNVPMAMSVTIPANLVGSVMFNTTVSTGSPTFTLNKVTTAGVATAIGTVQITAGSHSACTLGGSGVTLAIGETLQMVAPSSQDATLADIGITILAARV